VKSITDIGFKVANGQAQTEPSVWLVCRMSLAEVPRNYAAHFVRWEGDFELVGPPPHRSVIAASNGSGVEGFKTLAFARERALTKGIAKLSRDLRGQISRYLRETPDH
jgi:hypothetical protein